MVHALREARRVLKPNSVLIDLRPAVAHREAGIVTGGCYRKVGKMQERLEIDRAANRAIAQVLHDGLFRIHRRARFEGRCVYDTFAEFRGAICRSAEAGELVSYKRLLRRVELACQQSSSCRIETRGPLSMNVLVKQEGAGPNKSFRGGTARVDSGRSV